MSTEMRGEEVWCRLQQAWMRCRADEREALQGWACARKARSLQQAPSLIGRGVSLAGGWLRDQPALLTWAWATRLRSAVCVTVVEACRPWYKSVSFRTITVQLQRFSMIAPCSPLQSLAPLPICTTPHFGSFSTSA